MVPGTANGLHDLAELNSCVETGGDGVVGRDIDADARIVAHELTEFGPSTVIAANRGTSNFTRPTGRP